MHSISFITATLNSERTLDECLNSIRSQDYPQELVEIIISDGGSTDGTLEITKKYHCRIIENKKVRCEPGVALGIHEAAHELCTVSSSDNALAHKDWIQRMVKPFDDENIMAAFPRLINKRENTWLTKYVNTFTDPFNHFVYGYANNPTTFHKAYKIREATEGYVVYDFHPDNHPILAFDQGFTLRKSYQCPPETEGCDILPVIDMIKKGMKIAYVPSACNYHYTLEGGLRQFIRKQKWGIDSGLSQQSYGFTARRQYLSRSRKAKQYIWPFYSLSFVFPLLRALYGAVVERKKDWLYHPFISFVSGAILAVEITKIKVLRQKPLVGIRG